MSFRYPKGGFIQLFFDPLQPGTQVNYTLYTVGENTYGQLGLNYSQPQERSSPIQVGSLGDWSQIYAGTYCIVATKEDGTLWSWGRGTNGRLGSNAVIDRSSPVQVGALTNWSSVANGIGASVKAVKADGTLWAWGYNLYGSVGDGTTADKSSPVQIGAGTDWAYPVSGTIANGAVKTNGELWLVGYNGYGQLGQNNRTNRSSPVQVAADKVWSKVTCGSRFTAGITTDGKLWSWGANEYGQLGLSDIAYRSSPTQVGALTNWSYVGSSAYNIFAIKNDGTLWAAGFGGSIGQNSTVHRSSPVQVGLLTNWLSVNGADSECVAVKTDGTLWAWGSNTSGCLGLNISNLTTVSSPTQVGSLTGWVSATTSDAYTSAFTRRTTGT